LRFHRDALDRLRRIDGLDRPWSADYDPLGRRTRKTHGEASTEYFWDTDRLAAELRHDGSLRVYVYADDFSLTPWLTVDYDSVDADPASGKLHYLVTDQRGASVAALDAEGERVWTARLDPYGLAQVEADGEFELSLRLAGQFCDVETGLHYNRFRYYSPEFGRYIEEDPAGTGGGVNLYAYTSDPLVHFDARGLMCSVRKKRGTSEDGEKKTVSVFRVEGENSRIKVDKDGNVTIHGDGMLFLNFGDKDRADGFLSRRNGQYGAGNRIISFQVDASFLQKLRDTSITERQLNKIAKKDKSAKLLPLRVDKEFQDQYGLRRGGTPGIDDLQAAIIPGSGKVH
jgi:RHS repeat-associated protein